MKALAGLVIILGVLIAACGGATSSESDERVLQLSHGDYVESEYRVTIRAAVLNDPVGTTSLCNGLVGLSDDEAIEALVAAAADRDAGGLGRPVIQKADPSDDRRAAAIIVEECGRLR